MKKIKSLIRKLFRTPTTRRAAAGGCKVIQSTELSEESSVAPEPALSPSATIVSEDDAGTRESSRTLSLSREGTPSPHVRETEVVSELPEQAKEPKGKGKEPNDKEPYRPPSPVLLPPTKVKVEVPDLSGTTVAEASSSNTLVQPPTTPKRSRTIAALDTDDDDDDDDDQDNSGSPRKRRMEAAPVIIQYDPVPGDWDNRPPTPVIKYEDSDSGGEENPFVISPDVQRHYDLGPDAAPIPFQRSFLLGPPTPPPPGVPLYHPSFPGRDPLRCRQCKSSYYGFDVLLSKSVHNPGRYYYVCRQCNNFTCWADDQGVNEGNLRCNCTKGRYLSREDITSERATTPRKLFYKCATGACSFIYYTPNPLSKEEVNEHYGRRIYPV
ncbi:hypothetical protein F4813DRAFT_386450 [Daldinia decipiens]|uniref:uncharacterized protein n=1 Tax=Daldinia decipiens TaxID=326647 RepID=UPI0020C50584|nr:uncharacterized protein F4813DRAFT_386450 [Daldinia decipiens]KAI1661044.1 hypothetical protein F4813DRAFT_386450 [Daldinia decipiens]